MISRLVRRHRGRQRIPQAREQLHQPHRPERPKDPDPCREHAAERRARERRDQAPGGERRDLVQREAPLEPERLGHRVHRRDVELEGEREEDHGPDARAGASSASIGSPTATSRAATRVRRRAARMSTAASAAVMPAPARNAVGQPVPGGDPDQQRAGDEARPAVRARSGPSSPRRARGPSGLDGVRVDRDVLGGRERHDRAAAARRAARRGARGRRARAAR